LSINKTGSPGSTYGNGITLRGAGADQTFLQFTGTKAADYVNASIIVYSGEHNCCPRGGGTIQHSANWTAGYTKGTSVVTLSSTTGLGVGNLIVLDQQDDTVDGWPATGDTVVSCAGPTFTVEGGCLAVRVGRGNAEVHTVVAINGSNVTIAPGIEMPNFRSGQNPGAWWGNYTAKGVGIENLSIDSLGNGGHDSIGFYNSLNSWVKGVRSITTGSNYLQHIHLVVSGRITIRDSYFYGPQTVANTNYGISPELASDLLIENNILQAQQSAVVQNDPDHGSVWSYNYFADTSGSASASFTPHGVGNGMVLYEGNDATGMTSDAIHGQGLFITQFRNFMNGGSLGRAVQWIQAWNRFFSLVGNVMGANHYTTYETTVDNGSTVYALGDHRNGTFPDDSNVKRTSMRWGNYAVCTGDPACNLSRFVVAEVPSGIPNFSNSVPASQVLPPSFYLAAQPPWWTTPWGTPSWPAVGPDVTGGDIPGYAGHAWKIPARLCFENAPIDSAYGGANIRLFNASACYASATSGSAPSAPTNVMAQ
jgi:hypothetical protein